MDIIETSVKRLYEEKIDDLEKIDKSQLKYKELEPDQVEKLAEKN